MVSAVTIEYGPSTAPVVVQTQEDGENIHFMTTTRL